MPPSDVAMALVFPLLGPLPGLGLQFRHLRSGIMISYSLFLENVYWGPLCVRQLEDKVHYVPSGSHGWEERERNNKRSVPNRPSTGPLVSTEEEATDSACQERWRPGPGPGVGAGIHWGAMPSVVPSTSPSLTSPSSSSPFLPLPRLL